MSMSLDDMKPVESKGVDFSDYEGQKKEIETVEVIETTTPYDEDGQYHSDLKRTIQVLRVATGVVTKIETEKGEKEIMASELFNMKQDEKTGEWGWSSHKKAKLRRFMTKMGVNHPKDLKGKVVILKVRKKEGSDNEFLGFFTE